MRQRKEEGSKNWVAVLNISTLSERPAGLVPYRELRVVGIICVERGMPWNWIENTWGIDWCH